MGYTHYFTTTREIERETWNEFVSEFRRLLDTTAVDIAGWDGSGSPEITDEVIRFNGLDGEYDLSHETFTLHRNPATADGFNFCKTARKPYDEVVTAGLILAKIFFGDAISIGSDGSWYDWEEGRNLYHRTFGKEAINIFEEVLS